MPRWTLLLAILVLPSLAAGQDKASAEPANSKVHGFSAMKIGGFTVSISDETIREDSESKLELKPLAALESELRALTSLTSHCSPKLLKAMHAVPIWVEWDVPRMLPNGRPGRETGHYDGSKVVISNMKRVTELHQPKVDRGKCVLLHEMGHAVHHRVLGVHDPEVLVAYRQAMERKLLDLNMYATTNEKEFFAEMSCAYFNHLSYYPKTRADLKKNDPVTFKLMERVWGQTPLPPAAPNQTSQLPPGFSLDEAVVGEPALGPKESIQTLWRYPVLAVYWNAKDPSSLYCFRSISAWHAELADFGLKTVAIHLGPEQADDLTAVAKARNIRMPVFACKWKDQKIVALRKDLPQALVFDHEGKCIFNGRPFDAEHEVRAAVGEAVLAKADIGNPEGPLQGVVDALRAGKPPLAQLAEFMPLKTSTDDAMKTEAQKLYDALVAGPELALVRAEELAKTDPVTAYLRANWLATKYQGLSVGTQAKSLVATLKQNPDVAVEAQAQAALVHVRKLDNALSSHAGAFDPTLKEFQSKNAATLKKLHDAVQEMKKAFPDAKATEQAIAIAGHYAR